MKVMTHTRSFQNTCSTCCIISLLLAGIWWLGCQNPSASNIEARPAQPNVEQTSASPSPAQGRAANRSVEKNSYDAIFRPLVADLKQETSISILLPNQLPKLASQQVYANPEAERNWYSIRLESDPDCDKANVCFLGLLDGRRGVSYSYVERVTLSNGLDARYKETTCGGSCSPPAIEWKEDGVLYSIQLQLPADGAKNAKEIMVRLANESIASGPR